GLARIVEVFRRRRPDLPVGAIAGIDAANAAATIKAGADGVAVISALSLASSPPDAARELPAIVDAALADRARPSLRLPCRSRARPPAVVPASRPISKPSRRSASMELQLLPR